MRLLLLQDQVKLLLVFNKVKNEEKIGKMLAFAITNRYNKKKVLGG